MKIDMTHENDIYMIKLEGFLDTASSPELQKMVEEISSETFEKGGFNVVFDLGKIDFVSSAGLRVLLLTKKLADRQNGKIAVINVQQSIREVFDMTGFSKFLNLK
jgi:anti-anti-sigma factor